MRIFKGFLIGGLVAEILFTYFFHKNPLPPSIQLRQTIQGAILIFALSGTIVHYCILRLFIGKKRNSFSSSYWRRISLLIFSYLTFGVTISFILDQFNIIDPSMVTNSYLGINTFLLIIANFVKFKE
ncbi:MAG: hypothetical protein AB8B73_10410 [Ekhidna sp.]